MEQQLELQEKRNEYKSYIDEHRANIKKAFSCFQETKLDFLSPEESMKLAKEIEEHDMSKYGEEEFEPYRKHFFPCSFESKKASKEEFEKAKTHHYFTNDHHPQNPSRKEGLNKVACIHNILDWIAMSYKFKDDVWKFYSSSKVKEELNPLEKGYIEEVLKILEQYKDALYKPEEREI